MALEWEYEFGHLEWEGKTYREDLIILPDRIVCPWRREKGHKLRMDDLIEVVAAKPKVLVIGTGSFGVMKVPNKVLDKLAEKGIDGRPMPTEKALKHFVEIRKKKSAAAALHLTC